MSRKYNKVKMSTGKVFELREKGKSNPEKYELLRFSNVKSLKNLTSRHNRQYNNAFKVPKRCGWPRKESLTDVQKLQAEIARLGMENELLI